MKKVAFCILMVLVFTALQPAADVQASSCSAVCTTFYAAYPSDCTDLNCYALNCGAPNGYDWGSGTCSCSYCP
ncbi:MAG TPA: hypothetical protein VIW92_16525 [Thermoanaerobaculia bacterium]